MSKSIHVWIKSSDLWHFIAVQVIPNISNNHSAFIRLKHSKNRQPDSADEGTAMFQKGAYLPASNQEGPGSTLGQSMWDFFTQSGTGTAYAPSTSDFPCQLYSTISPYLYFIHQPPRLHNLSKWMRC